MKTTMKKTIPMLIVMLFGFTGIFAQGGTKTETFKVWGNCGMCKSTIEGALKKKDGITKKSWDKNTKMITVTYDSSKITIDKIHQKIADVGYDTEKVKAKDEVYNKLHGCCQYDREK